MTTNIFELFELIGYRDAPGSDDEAVVELPVAPQVVNTNGGLQGGLLATLVDTAAGKLAMRGLPPGHSVVTSDLNLRYLRPVTAGAARAVARIVHTGKRSMVIQVDIFTVPDNDLAVVATVSFAKIQAKEATS
ncbi:MULTISPECIES: PaaI family thioesterase [Mycobacterium]|uniref:Transcriptional regulator n=1 Tax=Mycobacterium syngnathidarum TaxID=1908205 RepID=A0A1Q9WFC9_9MYCO|nr:MULTISPECIES: PaaI family thioesterase [Mycobacterium]MCG7608807.1 PaaI family thioesterase [Mycobacterium sp. CnD-18-1]OHU01497.1 transcriptional regulator [Mycobacterium syngnathidarum]OLT97484.1 transcriptional regulator [Mycobacterium syngnathidarum]